MINFLSSWVKNLSLALIIVSILEMILPNNKTKKYVKMIMGLYILFSIISPFIENSDEFDLNNVNLNFYSEETKETTSISENTDQTSMDNRLNEIYKEELQKDITKKIEDKGYKIESCKVTAHISQEDSGIEKIVLKIKAKINEDGSEQQERNTIESKLVKEIQKIQKVEVNTSKNSQDVEDSDNQENTNLTKTDIKIIKDFLMEEYGVSEECLKIS